MRYAIALAFLASTAACRGGAGGEGYAGPSGSSLGVADDSTNIVERKYNKPSDQVWNVVLSSLEDSGMTVDNARSDAFGGWLNAHRADESRISIEVKSISKEMTSVAIHCSDGDRILCNRIHSLIAEKLGLAG